MNQWFKDSEVFFENIENNFIVGANIQKGVEEFKVIPNSIVIFGIDEINSDATRREFYKTSFPFEKVSIFDLGNIRNKNPEFINQAISQFKNDKINLVILGSDSNICENIVKNSPENVSDVAFVEKSGNLFFQDSLQQYFITSPNILKAGLISYQTHLLNPKILEIKKFNNSIRLGKLRNDFKELEPVLRNVDFLVFNLDSIRYSEVPGVPNTSPSGLTSEEASQIMKYLGLNNQQNYINFVGFDTKYDFHKQGAMLISQLIWYYIEGVDQQIFENIDDPNSIVTFVVELQDYNLSLQFIQSKKTGRWWVQIPEYENEPSYFVACSQEDFDKAKKNELSHRIFNELGF